MIDNDREAVALKKRQLLFRSTWFYTLLHKWIIIQQ